MNLQRRRSASALRHQNFANVITAVSALYALAVGAGEVSPAVASANRHGLVAAVATVGLPVAFQDLGNALEIGAGEVVALPAAVLPAGLRGLVAPVLAVDVPVTHAPARNALAVGAAKVDFAAVVAAARCRFVTPVAAVDVAVACPHLRYALAVGASELVLSAGLQMVGMADEKHQGDAEAASGQRLPHVQLFVREAVIRLSVSLVIDLRFLSSALLVLS